MSQTETAQLELRYVEAEEQVFIEASSLTALLRENAKGLLAQSQESDGGCPVGTIMSSTLTKLADHLDIVCISSLTGLLEEPHDCTAALVQRPD